MKPRPSQYYPGHEIPEKSWVYRFAKRHWFNDFGAYAEFEESKNRLANSDLSSK